MILEEMLQEERVEGMAEGIPWGQALSVLEILRRIPRLFKHRVSVGNVSMQSGCFAIM